MPNGDRNDAPPGRQRQIVALGGGGFTEEGDRPLDRYILRLAGAASPRVCFIATATGDAPAYIQAFYDVYAALPCLPTHLALFQPPETDLRTFVLSQDIAYVGGGSTRNMLALWREWALDSILAEAWERGVVLAGVSAGAVCWFDEGISDSVIPGQLAPLRGLGFLPGSGCPHYDSEPERRPMFHRLVRDGAVAAGYAADDGVALHFVGASLARAVSARPDAGAYYIERRAGDAVETRITPMRLGPGEDDEG